MRCRYSYRVSAPLNLCSAVGFHKGAVAELTLLSYPLVCVVSLLPDELNGLLLSVSSPFIPC